MLAITKADRDEDPDDIVGVDFGFLRLFPAEMDNI